VALRTDNLQKRYGDVQALDGVSISACVGDIFGVLGPNGAGKTTLIEILEGLRLADSGTATVLDVDVRSSLTPIRHRIGIAIQHTVLPRLLTVDEVLRLYHALYPQPRDREELLALMGLEDKKRALIHTLSGGQLQRLAIALALIGDPDILFLDEPTADLDPQARRAVWEVLVDPKRTCARTVILTTHQMEEAQRLCNRVAIVDHGRVLAVGSPLELIHQYCPGQIVTFTTDARAEVKLPNMAVSHDVLRPGSTIVRLRTNSIEQAMTTLIEASRAQSFDISDLRVEQMTLEDVFLQLTGRRIRN
jgi:ABC-2 type transport system ATP-binding protein